MSNFHFDIQEVELKEDQIYLDQFNIELKFEGKTDSQLENYEQAVDSVSYTHLTLPTSDLV